MDTIAGFDSLILNDRVISDFGDGINVQITHPNDTSAVKASKNGNTLYVGNEQGRLAEMTVRIARGSSDDKWLNARFREWTDSPRSRFVFFTGSAIKNVGDGRGGETQDVYQISGGVPKKNVEYQSSADGEIEQAVAVYVITLAYAKRSHQ